MNAQELQLSGRHQVVLDHFVVTCQEDTQIVGAILSGSHARGKADAYSDLDLGLILADGAYNDFFARREAFVRHLGKTIFLQDYHGNDTDLVFFILADGIEGEIALGRESHFTHILMSPHKVLLDKTGCLDRVVFTGYQPTQDEQIKTLQGLITWFWHDLLHHFLTPIVRNHLWSAYGGLEDLRRICVDLARLKESFQKGADGYEKVEQALSIEQLAPLQPTFCLMEREAMLQAALIIVRFYQQLAPSLAQTHDIAYPAELGEILFKRLERLVAYKC